MYVFFFCLAHKAGSVKLQIACNGIVISNSEVFEFRASNHHPKSLPLHAEWFDMSSKLIGTFVTVVQRPSYSVSFIVVFELCFNPFSLRTILQNLIFDNNYIEQATTLFHHIIIIQSSVFL